MTYATVMVSLALDQPNDARLAVGCQIAERFDAGLVGIVAAVFSPPPYFAIGEPGYARRMALCGRLSGTLRSEGGAMRRHYRLRGPQ